MSLGIHPFELGCLHHWHIIVHSTLLYSFFPVESELVDSVESD